MAFPKVPHGADTGDDSRSNCHCAVSPSASGDQLQCRGTAAGCCSTGCGADVRAACAPPPSGGARGHGTTVAGHADTKTVGSGPPVSSTPLAARQNLCPSWSAA